MTLERREYLPETIEPNSDEGPNSLEKHGREVRDLFESTLGLDQTAREIQIRNSDAAPGVMAEVRSLLGQLDATEQADPGDASWANDPRLDQTVIGQERAWRLIRVLGEGGSGRVYEGHDEDGGPSVAIKMLDAANANPMRLARFRDELRALQAVNHPGVIGEIDADLEVSPRDHCAIEPWIATELIPNARSITEFTLDLPEGPDRIEAIIDLLVQLTDAVNAAHHAGIVHRDLKPSNVLVATGGRLRIIDFGIASLQDTAGEPPPLAMRQTRDGDLLGTPAYMAPEQVDASLGPIKPATDVYTIGVIAFRILADRLPYAIGDTLLSAAQAIRYVPPSDLRRLNPLVPVDISDLIERCLQKSPADRPSGDELISGLRRDPPQPISIGKAERENGRWFRVTAITAGITALFFGVSMFAPSMMKRDTTVTKKFDPITSGTSIPNGAGDSDMRWKTVSGGILAGAFLTGTACGQDAIQWQTNAGGNGHWYQLDPTAGINWTDSRSRALARGGDLASIESAEENSILAGPVLGDFQIDGDNQVWLGGRKSDSWEWVDGTEFNFTSWDCPGAGSPCQPDNTGTAMAAVRSFDQVLYWNDIYDTPSYAAGFFIEWSADCNGDGIVDYGQILDGTFTDVNQNGVPDCCDAGQACDIVLHVPGDYATISAAIDAAADGATIRIASGTYT